MKKYQKGLAPRSFSEVGEIATLLTLGTFLIIGAISLISSSFLKKPQTSVTKAEESCQCVNGTYQGSGCVGGQINEPCSSDAQLSCFSTCLDGPGGKTPDDCNKQCNQSTANCSNSNKLDLTGTCNPACCTVDDDCKANGPNQKCSVQNGYCKSGLSCAAVAQGQTAPLYARVCGGASNGTCGWTFCNGTTTKDPVRGIDVPCQADQNTAPAPMCQGDSDCAAPVTNNTCFYLTDEIFYNSGQGFDHHVKFWSPPGGGDGHITLARNGANTGIQQTAWNKGQYNPYVIEPNPDPNYGAGHNLGPGTYTFDGTADHCKQGIGSASVSCTTGINNPDGTAYVRGANCTAKNFTNTPPKAVPTPTPTLTPTPGSEPNSSYCLPQMADGNGHKYTDGKCYLCKGAYNKPVLVDDSKCSGSTNSLGNSCFDINTGVPITCTPTPTKASSANTQQTVGKCTDVRLGAVMSCPTTDQSSNPSIKKYINCGATGAESETCQIFCVSVNDPKIRAECYSGEFTDSRLIWGPDEFKVSIINGSTGIIHLKSLYIQTYGLGGTGKDKTDAINTDLVSGQILQRPEPGVACSDEWTRGDRTVIAVFTRPGKNTDDLITIQVGCDRRPVITITN